MAASVMPSGGSETKTLAAFAEVYNANPSVGGAYDRRYFHCTKIYATGYDCDTHVGDTGMANSQSGVSGLPSIELTAQKPVTFFVRCDRGTARVKTVIGGTEKTENVNGAKYSLSAGDKITIYQSVSNGYDSGRGTVYSLK